MSLQLALPEKRLDQRRDLTRRPRFQVQMVVPGDLDLFVIGNQATSLAHQIR